MRKQITHLLMLLFLMIALTDCQSKKNNGDDNAAGNFDYPISIIEDTIAVNIYADNELYPLRDEVQESFLEKVKNFQGRKWTAKTSIPEIWKVQYIERLQEGKELWKIVSENRDWIYLITTSGYGTQRILDVLPVALNITNQNGDDLETEVWKTYRLPDGKFITIKEYEWIHSMANATKQDFIKNPEKYHNKSKFTEQFFINDEGRFEKSEIIDTLPDYNCVIFFFNKDEKPELWDETIPYLQAFCEENGILFEEVCDNFDRVTVRDLEFTFAIESDITPYVEIQNGMVMMRKNQEPKAIHFGSQEYMQMEIRRFFKLHSDIES